MLLTLHSVQGTSVLSPFLHIGSVITLAVMIYKKSAVQLFEKHPCLYILTFGFVSAKITNKLVVSTSIFTCFNVHLTLVLWTYFSFCPFSSSLRVCSKNLLTSLWELFLLLWSYNLSLPEVLWTSTTFHHSVHCLTWLFTLSALFIFAWTHIKSPGKKHFFVDFVDVVYAFLSHSFMLLGF